MVPDTDQTIAPDAGQGQAEGTDSGDSDLNSLLSEFQEGTTPKATEPVAAPEPVTPAPVTTVVKPDLSALDPVISFVKAQMQKTQRETHDKDIDAAVEKIGETEAFKDLPKTLIERMLISHAYKDSGFDKAFQDRAGNPAAWDTALEGAQTNLAEEVKGLTFAKERDDIEAAKATVDGITEGTSDDDGPTAIAMSKMSDAEWESFVEEELLKEAS